MNLGGVIDSIGAAKTITVKPGAQSVLSGGMWVDQVAPAPQQVTAVVAPATDRDTSLFPQGEIANGDIVIFTKAPLGQARPGYRADRVIDGGKEYEVLKSQDWSVAGFWKNGAREVLK